MVNVTNASYTETDGIDRKKDKRIHRFYLFPSKYARMWAQGWTVLAVFSGSTQGLYKVKICYQNWDHIGGAYAVKDLDGEYTLQEVANMKKLVRVWGV